MNFIYVLITLIILYSNDVKVTEMTNNNNNNNNNNMLLDTWIFNSNFYMPVKKKSSL